jgi:hypothetical protein
MLTMLDVVPSLSFFLRLSGFASISNLFGDRN